MVRVVRRRLVWWRCLAVTDRLFSFWAAVLARGGPVHGYIYTQYIHVPHVVPVRRLGGKRPWSMYQHPPPCPRSVSGTLLP